MPARYAAPRTKTNTPWGVDDNGARKRQDLVLNVNKVASTSFTGAPASGHQPTVTTGSFLAGD